MRRPWWLWLRPVVHKLAPSWLFSQWRWWRKLWGGHWEKWFCDPCHCELWMLNQHGHRPGACFGTPVCEDYNMPLTTQQVSAIGALDWLLDLNDATRRQGRSVAMAVALIRLALRNPNLRVSYLDHMTAVGRREERARDMSREWIVDMIRADPVLRDRAWSIMEHHFSFLGTQPIGDWWPSDEALGVAGVRVQSVERRPLPLSDPLSVGVQNMIRAAEDQTASAALNAAGIAGIMAIRPHRFPIVEAESVAHIREMVEEDAKIFADIGKPPALARTVWERISGDGEKG